MSRDTLKRLKLRDQLSVDPLKIFSLFEKTVLAYIAIGLVLIVMKKTSLIEASLDSTTCATTGYLVMTTKLFYHDESLSELTTHTDINPDKLKSAMLAIDYSEREDGIYYPKKRMFAFFTSANPS